MTNGGAAPNPSSASASASTGGDVLRRYVWGVIEKGMCIQVGDGRGVCIATEYLLMGILSTKGLKTSPGDETGTNFYASSNSHESSYEGFGSLVTVAIQACFRVEKLFGQPQILILAGLTMPRANQT